MPKQMCELDQRTPLSDHVCTWWNRTFKPTYGRTRLWLVLHCKLTREPIVAEAFTFVHSVISITDTKLERE